MRRKEIDRNAVLQPPRAAAIITGLSARYILDGCKNNKIPHVRVGNDYRVNMVLFLRQLDEQSIGGTQNAQ